MVACMAESSEIANADSTTPAPANELLPQLYDELRRLAAQKMGREGPRQTPPQATALVHEAWLSGSLGFF